VSQVVMGSDPAGLHNKDKCFEAIRKARELADKIEEHLQKIRDNLPSMAGLCIPNELCAALPRRPADKTLFEKWEEYRGPVRDVEGLKRTLEEEPRKIDNIAPVPEGSGGVFPCIPLPEMTHSCRHIRYWLKRWAHGKRDESLRRFRRRLGILPLSEACLRVLACVKNSDDPDIIETTSLLLREVHNWHRDDRVPHSGGCR